MYKTIINPVIRDEVTFNQTAAGTEGRVTTLIVTLMPGGGTPMHYHRSFTETFIVTEGELTIVLKKRSITLREGQEFTAEKYIAHRFENTSGKKVVFTTVILPASPGFEKALCILYGLAADNRTNDKGVPSSFLDLAAVSEMSDLRMAGTGMLFAPVLRLFAIAARIMGIDKKLIAKYCF